MRKIAITLVILVLVGATLACSFTIDTDKVKVGETQVLDINEPVPTDLAGARVEIEMGAGKLNVAGGARGSSGWSAPRRSSRSNPHTLPQRFQDQLEMRLAKDPSRLLHPYWVP